MKVLGDLDLNNNSIKNAQFELVAKIEGGVEDNIVKIDENGYLVDSGVNISEVGGGGGDMSNYYTKTQVDTKLNDKQDVINDLADIRSGAALGATALQEHQDISGKQDVLVSGTNIKTINNQSLLGEGNITIEGGGGTSVQSDWEQNDTEAADYIKHKPDLSGYVESSDLASVATSGDYTDLSNTPDLSDYITSSDLATVATSGDYTDLSNTPNLASVATSGDYEDLSNTPDLSNYVTESALNEAIGYVLEDGGYVTSDSLATVATSGDYTDLDNTPDLSGYVESSDLATVATSGDYTDLSNTPNLASVATSGDYEDLSNTPDLSDYVTTDGLESAIEDYLYDNLETLIDESGALSNYPIKDSFGISETDTQGQYTYTYTLTGHTDLYPIVQIVYDDQLVFSDVTVTFGTDPNEDNSTTITVTWDNTKYPVDSNNLLRVVYMIL